MEMGEDQLLQEELPVEIPLEDKVVTVVVMDILTVMNFIMVAVPSTVEAGELVLVMGLIALMMRATPISLEVLLSLEQVEEAAARAAPRGPPKTRPPRGTARCPPS